jgi:hypothetical protein
MKPWIAAAVVLALGGPLSAQAPSVTSPRQATDEDKSSTNETVFPAWMAGRWTASPFEVELTTDFHRSVYGAGARSVRVANLTIRPNGEGTFTVTSSVRDGRGRTVAGTREIEEVRFTIGDLKQEVGYQPRYTSRVVAAERRYPDDPGSTFPLDGAKLELFVPEGKAGTLEVRFETPEGRGSFWETLRRASAAAGAPRS